MSWLLKFARVQAGNIKGKHVQLQQTGKNIKKNSYPTNVICQKKKI